MASFLQLTANASFDLLKQLSLLVRDPVYYGTGVPPGDGRPILLIPGLFAGDWTLRPLAGWLTRIGYRSYLSGIDLNVGCPRQKLEIVGWRAGQIARESNARITIIGHSLGGMLGRAAASTNSEHVEHVIALGSPIREAWAGVHPELRPLHRTIATVVEMFYGAPESCGTNDCGCGFSAAVSASVPPQSRFTAIYSRRDEAAHWRGCIDDAAPSYEVGGLHASLIVNPEVYRLLGAILADRGAASAAA